MRNLAIITIATIDGKVVEEVTVEEVDHINAKDYLSEVYDAVNAAVHDQGMSI